MTKEKINARLKLLTASKQETKNTCFRFKVCQMTENIAQQQQTRTRISDSDFVTACVENARSNNNKLNHQQLADKFNINRATVKQKVRSLNELSVKFKGEELLPFEFIDLRQSGPGRTPRSDEEVMKSLDTLFTLVKDN